MTDLPNRFNGIELGRRSVRSRCQQGLKRCRRRARPVQPPLGHQACRNGISTRYYRVSRLLDEFTLARADGPYPRLAQRLVKTWLLILDDWGFASLSGQGRHDLLDILGDRYHRSSALLASQVPIEHWHDVVGDPTFGDAILDRLLNNVHRITSRVPRGGDSTTRPRPPPP